MTSLWLLLTMNLHLLTVHPQHIFVMGFIFPLFYGGALIFWLQSAKTHFSLFCGIILYKEPDFWFWRSIGVLGNNLVVSFRLSRVLRGVHCSPSLVKVGKNIAFSYHPIDSWVPSQFEASSRFMVGGAKLWRYFQIP